MLVKCSLPWVGLSTEMTVVFPFCQVHPVADRVVLDIHLEEENIATTSKLKIQFW